MAIIKGTVKDENLVGTNSLDYIFGESGKDTIDGSGGNDKLFGGNANDSIIGGIGNDYLGGGAGVDTLRGGAGNDLMIGDAGFTDVNEDAFGDVLDGGAGNDEFSAEINDTVIGGAGVDYLFFGTDNIAPVLFQVSFANVGDAAPKPIGAAGTSLANTLVGQVEIVDAFFNEALPGSVFFGSRGADEIDFDIRFDPKNDTGGRVAGAGGDDDLGGSGKNDTINGGIGNDVLEGGFGGKDELTGGPGFDIYTFRYSSEPPDVDIIKDFSPRDDLIIFSAPLGSPPDGVDFGFQGNLLQKTATPVNGTTPDGIAQFIYETDAGRLYLDADGSGAGDLHLLMILSGRPNITAANIVVEYDDVMIA